MLPVLRNTITGLKGVDPAILEAAQGVGMTPRQSLFQVELPLALPVMMAGIRTAAVWLIGCFAAAALALAVDQLLALIETGIARRSRPRAALGGLGIAALVAATLVPSLADGPSGYVVGAKTFAEQYVLSALMTQRLKAAGFEARTREGLGSNVIFEALASN